MRIVVSVTVLLLVHLAAYPQTDVIKWNKDVKIEWSDFKGKTDEKSAFAAMSAVGFYYKYNTAVNGNVYKIKFTTEATFDRTRSWSKKNSHTPVILKHEQLHFDIAELVARAFKREAEHSVYSKYYKNEIGRIFDKYSLTLQQLQRKYDLQSMHSNNKAKQNDWQRIIHEELQK
ncbi:MAG: hypothetical protein M3040_18485 [Bacteroidota bacterium]|nr:hypothetical protein [Bacteroidota bacterium]